MKQTSLLQQKQKVSSQKTIIEIHHGDCVAGMARMEEKSVDLVVTSPPYNLGIKYRSYKDDQARKVYLEWCLSWGKAIQRVLKDAGSVFLNVGASPSNPMLPHEIVKAFSDQVFTLQNTIHWIKAITIRDDSCEWISRGHFKPISSPRFLNDCHEYVFHFTKDGRQPIDRLAIGVPYADKSNIARWGHTKGRDRRCLGNTWFIPYKTIQNRAEQRPHPATFPVELVEKCILLQGADQHSCMLDPFLGIGTAGVAARRRGIGRFVGFEIDSCYLKEASRVLEVEVTS